MTLAEMQAVVELGAQPGQDATVYVTTSRMRAILACLQAADAGDMEQYRTERAKLDAIPGWFPRK